MRQTVIVAAATALIITIISIWTTVIIAHTRTRPDTDLASSSVDLIQMISDANKLADEKADPVD
jgi:hypothetical protein